MLLKIFSQLSSVNLTGYLPYCSNNYHYLLSNNKIVLMFCKNCSSSSNKNDLSNNDLHNHMTYQENINHHYEDYFKVATSCEQCLKIAEFSGRRQSPIDFTSDKLMLEKKIIDKHSVSPDDLLTFKWYNKYTKVDVIDNDGGNVLFSLQNPNNKLNDDHIQWPSITGGPLQNDLYKLLGFHFHWSLEHSNNEEGSEHHISNYQCPAELHLVHWNSSNYDCSSKAVQSVNGLAVIGVLLKTVEELNEFVKNNLPNTPIYHNNVLRPIKYNSLYDIICKWLDHVKYKSQSYEPVNTDLIQPYCFLPIHNLYKNPMGFYHYNGSLTTPPFNENVKWIVFNHPDFIKQEHLTIFRELHANTYEQSQQFFKPLGGNYRTVQSPNNRNVQIWLNNFNIDNPKPEDLLENTLSSIVNFDN